jgi:hypothetical protein
MYVIDTGFVLATLFFGAQLAIVGRYGFQRAVRGVTLAALVGTLLQHTFSAAAFANMTGTLIWSALGLVVIAWTLPPEQGPTASPAVSQRPRRAVAPASGAQLAGAAQGSAGAPAAASAATSADS